MGRRGGGGGGGFLGLRGTPPFHMEPAAFSKESHLYWVVVDCVQ